MKGKGKGDRGGDMKDCPLQFPDLNPVEHQRVCPTFTTGIVARPLGDLSELIRIAIIISSSIFERSPTIGALYFGCVFF